MSTRPLRPIKDESLDNLKSWYPGDRWNKDPPPDLFEIGLVLAGGQSAGCYLAGVLDFLYEALDCWEKARRADPDKFPNHKVRVKILVGASAGGLNAALAAICGRYGFAPAAHTQFENGDKNLTSPFYRAWVRDIDLKNLLTTDDLTGAKQGFSLLNTNYLDSKVTSYINFTGPIVRRDWLDDPLPLKITVSNLEGVPYRVHFSAERSQAANGSSLPMEMHRDHLAFLRPLDGMPGLPNVPDSDLLPRDNNDSDAGWHRLGQTVLATIAFPFALRQRDIERPSTDYDYRYIYPDAPGGLVYSPGFPDDKAQARQFITIDGGVMDNEPFEIAHAALAGSTGTNRREGDRAKRAIILIDPFVSPQPVATDVGDLTLPAFIGKFFNALIGQNRFKPIDLSLAEADNIYSRFMIAPVRGKGDNAVRGDKALASHALRSFMGYCSEHYRHHDFMLGRYNCYKFLRDWFILPSGPGGTGSAPDGMKANTLFATWPKAALDNPAFESQVPDCKGYRQIIPLTGTAAVEPGANPWPAGKFAGYDVIRAGVEGRIDALYKRCRDQLIDGAIAGKVGRFVGKRAADVYFFLSGRQKLRDAIRDSVEAARREIDGA